MQRHFNPVWLAFIFAFTTGLAAQDKSQEAKPKSAAAVSPVSINDPKAFQGYTLIPPLTSTKTMLVDMQGRVVKSWECGTTPGLSAYLLPNGHLLRPGKLKASEQFFEGAGTGGRIQEYTWDGEFVWDFKFHTEKQFQHHDVCKMPNGNVLDAGVEQEDFQGSHRSRHEGGQRSRQSTLRFRHRNETDGQNHRRGRVGMVRLGSFDSRYRQDQGELWRCRRPSGIDRCQLRPQ